MEDEVLPVYEQPLEKVEITDTTEAEEAVKEFFEEIMGVSEEDAHSGVSDGADDDENSAQGEYPQGDNGSVQGSGDAGEQGQEDNSASEAEETPASSDAPDSGEDSDLDSLYGSIDKFYL